MKPDKTVEEYLRELSTIPLHERPARYMQEYRNFLGHVDSCDRRETLTLSRFINQLAALWKFSPSHVRVLRNRVIVEQQKEIQLRDRLLKDATYLFHQKNSAGWPSHARH